MWTSHQDVPSRGVWDGEETSFLFCLHSSKPHSHWSHTEHCVPGMTVCKHVLCRVPVHSISLVGRTVWGTEHGFGEDRAGFYQGQKKSRVSKEPYDIDGPLNLSSIKREVQFFPPRLVPRPPQMTETCAIHSCLCYMVLFTLASPDPRGRLCSPPQTQGTHFLCLSEAVK